MCQKDLKLPVTAKSKKDTTGVSHPSNLDARDTKVYHIIYEPSFRSIIFHHWTECNLHCSGCFCRYEKLDFSLFSDWQGNLKAKDSETPPEHFLSVGEIMKRIHGLDIERAVFIGTEPSLDPGLPVLAREMHDVFSSYNILFTNGVNLIDYSDIDEVIFSIKAYSDNLYRSYTGRSNSKMLKNFQKLAQSGIKLQAEMLLIPGLIDKKEVEKVARFITSIDNDIALRIDGYFPIKDCKWIAATDDDIQEANEVAKKYLKNVNYLSSEMERVGEKTIRIF
jgi:pyruvate formate lyase activating enzyme